MPMLDGSWSMKLTLDFDDSGFRSAYESISDHSQVYRHTGRAIRRAMQTLKTHLVKGIAAESFLKRQYIRRGIRALGGPELNQGIVSGKINVNSGPYTAGRFRLDPNRVTTLKQRQSRFWPTAAYRIGPNERLRTSPPVNGLSRAWIGLTNSGRKEMFQRKAGSPWRNAVRAVSLNYFSVFDRIQEPALQKAAETFEKRFAHEMNRLLGGEA